jgi:AhpD family alkylhydroperoxidase
MEQGTEAALEGIVRSRKKAHQFFSERSAAYRAFLKLQQEAFADGDLDRRTKELIAVGISVAVNCESCMEWHIREALRRGATEQQVIEAMDVAMEMGGGPATVAARFGMNVLEYDRQKRQGQL